MKAASLLEHKCFFLVFVFTGQQYFLSFKSPYAGGLRASVGNGLGTDLKRRRIGPALRLPAPSLRGRAGGEAVVLSDFQVQNYYDFRI